MRRGNGPRTGLATTHSFCLANPGSLIFDNPWIFFFFFFSVAAFYSMHRSNRSFAERDEEEEKEEGKSNFHRYMHVQSMMVASHTTRRRWLHLSPLCSVFAIGTLEAFNPRQIATG